MRKIKKGCKLFTCLVSCVLLFCGCAKQEAREIVLDTYQSWNKLYMDVWVLGPSKPDNEKAIEIDGIYYYRTDDIALRSIADIKKATEVVCTVSYAKKEFYEPYLEKTQAYLEKEGVLYRIEGEVPSRPYFEDREAVKFLTLDYREKDIHAKIEFMEKTLNIKIKVDIRLVKVDGKWLINSLEIKSD